MSVSLQTGQLILLLVAAQLRVCVAREGGHLQCYKSVAKRILLMHSISSFLTEAVLDRALQYVNPGKVRENGSGR